MDPKPLNPEHGEHKEKTVVEIDEHVCIGCTLCIQACPVDAILGAPKQMHTVIAERVHRLQPVHTALPGGVHPHRAGPEDPEKLVVATATRRRYGGESAWLSRSTGHCR